MLRNHRWAILPLAGIFLGGSLLFGCPIRTEHKVETTHKIEAHIVIDIRKVQEQASQIESEVRGEAEAPKAEPDPGTKVGAMAGRPEANYSLAAPRRSFWSIFDVSSSAAAAESDDGEAIARRKARAADIRAALDKGCLGENNKGYVALRPCEASQDAAEKARFQVLSDDENRDRKIIYTAVARRQGLEASHAEEIGIIFAGEIRKHLTTGQPFQVPEDDQQYEEFLKSDLAKKLGEFKPGEWTVVP